MDVCSVNTLPVRTTDLILFMQIYITHPNEVIAKPLLQLAQEQKQQNIRVTEKLERAPMPLAIAIYHNY